MASRNPPRSYDDATLDALEEALKDVWQVLKAHDLYPLAGRPRNEKSLGREAYGTRRVGSTRFSRASDKTLQNLCLGRPH
jgi:hypothetical protein